MIEKNILSIYRKMRIAFYRRVFTELKERESSLTATEMFSVDIIESLARPTIGEFAEFIGVSFPSATYKVNALEDKGYLKRVRSETDRRESYLELTQKYYDYAKLNDQDMSNVVNRIRREFTEQEMELLSKMLTVVEKELDNTNSKAIITKY
ncbi:MAG: MarR family transcriptional regulator [Oscillospiraceae bacterium]|nr:MarR family transcriptional regulator [Oscillospiraceae bacterium]